MKILIIGPVGSGKTTQAVMLAEKLGLGVLRVGDLVRERALESSAIGRQCQEALDSGHLLSDELAAEMVTKEISEKYQTGFVTDSYPRRISQLEYFDPHLDLVFFLKLQDDEVRTRLHARGRADDKPEIIEERLKVYHNETEPMLQLYAQQGKLITIDGHASVEEIHVSIMEGVKKI